MSIHFFLLSSYLSLFMAVHADVIIKPNHQNASENSPVNQDRPAQYESEIVRENRQRNENTNKSKQQITDQYILEAFNRAGEFEYQDLTSLQGLPANEIVTKLFKSGKLPAFIKRVHLDLATRPKVQIRQTILQNLGQENIFNKLKKHPEILDKTIGFLQDRYSVASFISFLYDRSAHLQFFGFLILSFIVSWVIGGTFIKAGHTFFLRLVRRFFLLGIFLAIRLGFFVFIYFDHLKGPYHFLISP